jgi:hypothetical protein
MPLINVAELWSGMASWVDAAQFQAPSAPAAFVLALGVGLAGGLSLSGSI